MLSVLGVFVHTNMYINEYAVCGFLLHATDGVLNLPQK